MAHIVAVCRSKRRSDPKEDIYSITNSHSVPDKIRAFTPRFAFASAWFADKHRVFKKSFLCLHLQRL